MNFTWCGQSWGSTSRAFVHERIHNAVIERSKVRIKRWNRASDRSGDGDGRDHLRDAIRSPWIDLMAMHTWPVI
jgi:hypothetical protein